jgi:hypothetical protein
LALPQSSEIGPGRDLWIGFDLTRSHSALAGRVSSQALIQTRDCFARAIAFIFSAASAVRLTLWIGNFWPRLRLGTHFFFISGITPAAQTPAWKWEMDALKLAEAGS